MQEFRAIQGYLGDTEKHSLVHARDALLERALHYGREPERERVHPLVLASGSGVWGAGCGLGTQV